MMSGRQKDATPDMWSGVTSIIDCKEINMAFTILPENPSFANAINNAVANITSPAASMTSKEIADMVGSRHDKTKQSIERLANQGVIVLPPMGDVPFVDESGRNRTTSAYIFSGEQGKRDSIVVVAQLSPQFTAALVDRWQELERQVRGVVQPQQLPTDYLSALKALVASEEAKLELERDNAMLNTILDNEFGFCSILRAAMHVGVHESTFKWQKLKSASLSMGIEPKRVPSNRYAYQLVYPIEAFAQCYPQFDFSGLEPKTVAEKAAISLSMSLAVTVH
jgi:phage regulator Rha-like protein